MSTVTRPRGLRIDFPLREVEELCRKLDVRELSVFGSALRDDFGPDSDVDLLVVFKNDDYGPWMNKLTDLEEGISKLLGRKVDAVPKESLKWVIRDRVIAAAEIVYVAAD
jgi:hypothetical protein